MLFVFGRRAKQVQIPACIMMQSIVDIRILLLLASQLRFNKISELIHNSQNHRNCEHARVTVHFIEIVDVVGQAMG